MKILHIILLLVALFVFDGCKKKGTEEPPKPKTPKEMLTKTWRISRVTINGSVDNMRNYGSYRITFFANGTYNIVLSDSPITIVAHLGDSGTWELVDNNTNILFDRGNPSREAKTPLLNLTETSFSVRFRADDKANSEYQIDFVPA
ncbi:lipocalin-like domain-containing protein [Thermoflexibacter ruber]|uniref:Lipocalin-like domain-containing protein n=1 Tax=Thermoflexibacter ruber TaxID=1003 RepID=A0A1I2K470_9BACT|nr:lipocalin family protein [Thermoflexibacter ruber]SFF61213.1 Lipocalin-like domain-containing protein [Thermoflexibacter ruber]